MAVDFTAQYTKDIIKNEFGEFVSPNFAFLEEQIGNFDEFVLQGSARCFAENTLVVTIGGYKKISEIKEGDIVKSFDGEKDVWNKVLINNKFINEKGTIKVTLKNGESFVCSDDHKFYHNGEWKLIIDILRNK